MQSRACGLAAVTVLIGCAQAREALSASLDGEQLPVEDGVLQDHLSSCPACRDHRAQLEQLNRRLRVRPAKRVPDLTEQILAGTVHAVSRSRPSGRRMWRTAAVAVAVTVVAALAGGVLGEHMTHSRAPEVAATQVGGPNQVNPRYPGALVLPRSITKPSVPLTDTSGQPFDLAASTAGRLTLVYFGYTRCPDVCPVNMALAADALALLPAADRRQVAVVFVTTDPSRDTPSVIRRWLDRFDPDFIGLTGTPAQIHQAEQEVAMPLSYADALPGSSYQIVHAGYTLVYAPSGTADLQVDATDTAADFAATLRHLLSYGYRPN